MKLKAIFLTILLFLLSITFCDKPVNESSNSDPTARRSRLPIVTTKPITLITSTTASGGGSITSSSSITSRGVCWSTSQNPTISLATKTSDGIGTGSFTSSLKNLSSNTTYYIRAYAKNSYGTGYGYQISFKTITSTFAIPTVTTTTITAITSTTATGGGNVTSIGGDTIMVRGICWATTQNPTTAKNITTNGRGIGTYTSSLINLKPDSTYYVRAYATNSGGTGYGAQISFKTLTGVTPPTGNAFYVSPSGNDNTGNGSITNPWGSLQKGINALSPGSTLYVRGGTYTIMFGLGGGNYSGIRISGKSGTSSAPITVRSYPGDPRPVLDCSSLTPIQGYHRGVLMDNCSYWNFYGLIIKNVREWSGNPTQYTGSAWEMADVSNINIEFCDVTYCMNGFSLTGLITNLHYKNCDAYENWDIYQGGDLCNGFNGNISAGSTITYIGCRAWKNCDDGYDNMAGGGYITYTNCWAFNNGPWHGGDSNGNGDGFKLGYSIKSAESGIQRTLYNCLVVGNHLMGLDESADATCTMNMVIYNCTVYNNTDYYNIRFNSTYNKGIITLRNNISIVPISGSHITYAGRSNNVSDHNTWNAGMPTANAGDFMSVDVTQLSGARNSDGSLPHVTAFHLTSASLLKADGILINGNTPDSDGKSWVNPPSLGAFQY